MLDINSFKIKRFRTIGKLHTSNNIINHIIKNDSTLIIMLFCKHATRTRALCKDVTPIDVSHRQTKTKFVLV
jgi:uracil DNA glycosylase